MNEADGAPRVYVLSQRVPDRPAVLAAPWVPLVVAALVLTLTSGALTGAIDLWTLRVKLNPVPIDHHRAHGFTQLFGFLGLFIMGISLHLSPRFFGAPPPSRELTRFLTWVGIGGVVLFVVGRLGSLVPGSPWLGLLGAAAVLATQTRWAAMVAGFWSDTPGPKDALQHFLLAGVGWWWIAAASLLVWQLGQLVGGPLAQLPLEPVWAAGLFGGVGSWLWGLFFRAGLCTLRVARPKESAQRRLMIAWQLATLVTVGAAWVRVGWLEAVASASMAGAVGLLWWTVRPFSGNGLGPGPLQPRAVQAGLVLVLISAGLQGWTVLGAFGLATPALLHDATRHAFTLGVTLMVLGFAGRMVPGFRGVTLRWPRIYDAGVMGVMAGAGLRLAELNMARAGLALAGASGALTFLGLVLAATSVLGSLRLSPREA